ncbi:MAG: protein serine phosphatase with GAF(s) sensor(s) [Actinomycetia bacterium]|nr:protein serine phosphatase with GAF(s) sensor(s) [Actinomycetes bacterium]
MGSEFSAPQAAGDRGQTSAFDALGRLRLVVRAITGDSGHDDTPTLLVTQAVASVGADGGVLGVIRDDASIDTIAHAGYPPHMAAAFVPLRIFDTLPLTDAARLGEEIWISSRAELSERYPQLFERTTSQAYAALPLVVNGSVVGVLGVSFEQQHVFTQTEQLFLGTLADLCALVLARDHLRVAVGEQPASDADMGLGSAMSEATSALRAEHQLAGLAMLAKRLSSALTSSDVVQIIVDSGNETLASAYASVALVRPERADISLLQPADLHEVTRGAYERFGLDAGNPIAAAIRENRAVIVADEQAAIARFPDIVDDRRRTGVTRSATIPLRRGDGQAFGALSVAWRDETELDDLLLTRVEAVADLCSQTLERTRLSDAHAALVSTLQRELLPRVPAVAGLDIAWRYLPAAAELAFGGDWYEVIALDDARTAIIVGDATGHGIEAAARMAETRGVIDALVRLGTDVADLFPQTTRLLAHLDEAFIATAAIAVVDSSRHELQYSTAGHPPPIICSPDGTVRFLEDAHLPVIGIHRETSRAPIEPFEPGSLLVLYTDGLVERRRESLDVGIGRLARAVREVGHAPVSADAIADHILHALLSDEVLGDDVALIVARHVE